MLPPKHKGRLSRTPGENDATWAPVGDVHAVTHFGKLHSEMVAETELDIQYK